MQGRLCITIIRNVILLGARRLLCSLIMLTYLLFITVVALLRADVYRCICFLCFFINTASCAMVCRCGLLRSTECQPHCEHAKLLIYTL